MRRRLGLLFFCLMLISCAMASCSVGNGAGDNDGDTALGSVYGAGITTYIVREKTHTDSSYIELLNVIKDTVEANGGRAVITDDGYAECEHEIVLGGTSRAISTDAAAALDKAIVKAVRSSDREEEAAADTAGYTVYASGGSVGVVWSDDSVKEKAVRYFIDNFLSGSTLELRDGYAHSKTFSYYAYLEEQDEKQREEEWAALEAVLGAEAADALKKHYAIFDERFYLWLADLYDPETGGFYYSNSARDTVGYLPDLESTRQALTFLDNAGMSSADGGWNYAISDSMAKAVAEFVKGLQSREDGYFYHPQWVGLTTTISRLSRDADWAIVLLSGIYNRYKDELEAEGLSGEALTEALADYMPYWDTPGGLKGSLGAPGASAVPSSKNGLTGNLGTSKVALVSKVVRAASDSSRWPEHLRSISAFKAYLEGLDIANDSYTVGNELVSQENQFLTRDAEAIAAGEVTKYNGYVATLKDFLNDAVNPENGLWESAVSYNSINGLMKIGELYDAMGWEIQFPGLALESAMEIAMTEGPDDLGYSFLHCCDVYNPWVAMQNIFKNVEKYATAEKQKAFNEKYRVQMQKNAAEIIAVTTKKTVEMAMSDGSYAFYSVESGLTASTSQGMPVSVKNTVEGDVNGAIISCTGIINNMCSALGVKAPSVFGNADMQRFFDRIEALENIVKDDVPVLEYPLTFDEYEIGETNFDGGEAVANESSLIYICDDPLSAVENDKAIIIDTSPVTTTNNKITFDVPNTSAVGANCYVFEYEMFIDNFGNSEGLQISMINKSGASFLSLNLIYDKNSKAIQIRARKDSLYGNDIIVGMVDAAAWTKIRIEYYPSTDKSAGTAVFYVGDKKELVGIVSDYMYDSSYYDENADSYGTAQMFCPRNTDYDLYIDNVTVGVERCEIPYIPPHDGHFDFDDVEIGKTSVKSTLLEKSANGSITVVDDPLSSVSGDNALFIDAKGTNQATFYKAEETPDGADCYVFETELYFDAEENHIFLVNMKNSSSGIFCSTSFEYLAASNEFHVRTRPTSVYADSAIATTFVPDGWVHLRIEYYPADITEVIYINDREPVSISVNYQGTSADSYLGTTVQSQNASDYDLYLDNVYVAEIDGSRVITVPSDGMFDFEDAVSGDTEVINVEIEKAAGNISVEADPNASEADDKALHINKADSALIEFMSAENVPSNANCYLFELDIYTAKCVAENDSVFLYLINSEGDAFVAVELVYNKSEGTFSLYELVADGERNSSAIAELDADGVIRLRIEYYKVNGRSRLYSGIEELGELEGRYCGNDASSYAFAAVGTCAGSSIEFYVDDIRAESIIKTYVADLTDDGNGIPSADNVTDDGWVE